MMPSRVQKLTYDRVMAQFESLISGVRLLTRLSRLQTAFPQGYQTSALSAGSRWALILSALQRALKLGTLTPLGKASR
jgi:hypothetical protein